MLGLPESTEVNKQLPKNKLYEKAVLNRSDKELIDANISRIDIVNIISDKKINVKQGKDVSSINVLKVTLKKEKFDQNSIILLSKIIKQKVIMLLNYEDKSRLAVYHRQLFMNERKNTIEQTIILSGRNLDEMWQNIIVQIGGITLEDENDLDLQIQIDNERRKNQNKIDALEKKVRAEKQPKRKLELYEQLQKMKKEKR